MDLEERVAAIEKRIELMGSKAPKIDSRSAGRRPECKPGSQGFARWLRSQNEELAEQRTFDQARTRFNLAKSEAHREFERLAKEGEQKWLAEVVAAIEIFERTGVAPEGYEIIP